MTDYSRSKIYKIVVNNTEDEYRPYIGSTTKNYLSERFTYHRQDYKKHKNGRKNSVSSFKLFNKYGIENCEIVLIENYPCATKDELRARERYWYDTVDNCNKCKPMRTEEEITNEGRIKYILAKERDPDLRKKSYRRELELHPDYMEKKKESYKKAIALNPNFNKEKDDKQKQNKYTCECGIHIRCDSKSKHIKSKKHLNYIATIAIQQEV
jgi:hypothetical protein